MGPEVRAYLFPGMPFEVIFPVKHLIPRPRREEASLYSDYDFSQEEPGLDRTDAAPESELVRCSKRIFLEPGKSVVEKACISGPAAFAGLAAAVPEEDRLDPRTELILAEIRRLQDKYKVSIDELEVLLGYTVKLSRLRILRSGRMFFPDFENAEICMPNVAKSLFFLYLKHPEGLRFKDVADHKEELVSIYGSITGRDDPDEIARSIDLLTDPFGNALNVNASRIKTAFRNVVSDRVARFYYINGAAGEIKKVPLDRDLVIWEY